MDISISVIIPTLNRCELLAGALASVRAQNFPADGYEMIVVDNGSADDTRELIDKINCTSGKPVHFVREERRGLHWARHSGARNARGHILAYIDDDCVVEPNWLTALYRAYSELEADAAGGKILIRWDREPPQWVVPYEPVLGKLDYGPEMLLLKSGQYINGGNFSILRSRLFEIGGFNPDQIDDYLIGNGETGLCDKIHRAGWKIAWVPAAIVWHLQKVDKNATLIDMKRRFANNGAGAAYHYFKYNNPSSCELLILSIYSYLRLLMHYCISLITRNMNREYSIAQQLVSAFYKARSRYLFNLIFNADLRGLVKKDDWLDRQ